jgi:hypothetical protein
MAWFYNSYSGELTHADGLDALAYEAAIHTATGWHELKISDKATAAQAAAEAKKEVPGGKTPTTSLAQGLKNAPSGVTNLITNAAGDILGLPTLSNLRGLMIRTAKVVVGMLLIAVGAVKLLQVESAVKDVAPVVAKAAMI